MSNYDILIRVATPLSYGPHILFITLLLIISLLYHYYPISLQIIFKKDLMEAEGIVPSYRHNQYIEKFSHYHIINNLPKVLYKGVVIATSAYQYFRSQVSFQFFLPDININCYFDPAY